MRSFNVYLNGEKLCTAGIGDNGVLTTIVTWVAGGKGESLFLNVGGLVSSTEEHIDWANQKPLRGGDEARIEIMSRILLTRPLRNGGWILLKILTLGSGTSAKWPRGLV